MRAAVLCLALALAACKPGGAGVTCLTNVKYSASFLKEAEKEIEQIERVAPNVVKMINDYGITRDAVRVCLKRKQ